MLDKTPRFLLSILLGISLAFVAFPVGVVLAGIFLVPEGSGLAGPTIALSYGALAVAVSTALSVVMANWLSRRALVLASYWAFGGAVISLLGIAIRILQLRE